MMKQKHSKAQVSMELMALIGLVLFVYGILMFETIRRNGEMLKIEDEYKKRIVCNDVANAVSDIFSLGEGAGMKLNFTYGYNISILGSQGFLSVGVPQTGVLCGSNCIYDGVTCTMPKGMMDKNVVFTDKQMALQINNLNGTVVVDVA